MGIAAYNRGSRAISQRLDAEMRPVEFELMDRLNALPKYIDAGTPFGPIRFIVGNGGIWAECPISGFGFWYKDLTEALRRWKVSVIGYHCGIWEAEPWRNVVRR